MDIKVKYQSDYEYYAPRQMLQQQARFHFSQEKFVVPWQMEEGEKESKKEK